MLKNKRFWVLTMTAAMCMSVPAAASADGYWMMEVPMAAGANQYCFTVNGADEGGSDWLIDPANPYISIYPEDGLFEADRRNFNPLYVHYDAETVWDFAPMAVRDIEVPRDGIDHGSWS